MYHMLAHLQHNSQVQSTLLHRERCGESQNFTISLQLHMYQVLNGPSLYIPYMYAVYIHMCYICLPTRAIHHTTYHRGHDHTLPYCGHNAQESNNDNTKSNSHEKCTAEQISALGECCILVLGGVYPYSNRHRYHTHCLQICTWDTRYCNCTTFLTSSVFPILQYLVQCLVLYNNYACKLP